MSIGQDRGTLGSGIFAAVLMTLIFLISTGLHAKDYEHFRDREVSEILPADKISGPNYRIRDTVACEKYMHRYTVDSRFGVFNVTGNGALRKLIKEIRAISILRRVSESEAFAESLKEAGTKPLLFGNNLIYDPADTLSGIPKGVSQVFQDVYTSLTTPQYPGQDSQVEQLLALSAYKRDYAHALGVDVYSSNPVLQRELNRVGWASVAGSLSFSAAMIPLGTIGTVIGYSRLGQQINDVLKSEPASRLRQINEARLLEMGVTGIAAKRFLDHPAFSPRHDTIITASLGTLRGTVGKDEFIRFTLSARNEESANRFMYLVEMLRGYHVNVSKLREIILHSDLVLARAENGYLLIPLPIDDGIWTEQADRVLTDLVRTYKPHGSRGKFELWVTGTLSSRAREELNRLGIMWIEHIDQKIEFMD